ncbi:carbohydrate esterase family 4 protein [Gymnopus androsaceus JB14]|uniref:chitin deacetylase n=1 Tax=Gymnopus androsaceus JB14 TaxID=1447944 RepID=A0A6A4HPK4_9AGAR|nr:carbohydrate esterase family 4 protein [Gymnopus androsaceus JB14]
MQPGNSYSRVFSVLVSFGLLTLVNAAADRTSEQGEATITGSSSTSSSSIFFPQEFTFSFTHSDPTEECTPYEYAPVTDALNSFPPVWKGASILSSDSAALAMWNSISDSIPTDIAVKVSFYASFISSNYSSSDPDCWWTYDQCITPKLTGLPPDVAAAPEPSTLGYGFDDGPNCSHNAFYDYLDSQNQKATFYFIGSNVAQWPLEAQRALTDGHEICAHTWSHPYMTTVASEDAFAELWYSLQMIKLAVGVTPTCWRPPYGDVDDRIRAIANALGLTTIMWKYDSQDADVDSGNVDGGQVTDADVVSNYNAFIQTAASGTFQTVGAILLSHEIDNFSMTEAISFYPQLKSVFQHIVPVGVSLNKTQPYVETNYSLPTFEQYVAGTLIVNSTTSSSTISSSSSSSTTSQSSTSSISSPSASSKGGQTTASKNAAYKVMDFGYGHVLLLLVTVFFWTSGLLNF